MEAVPATPDGPHPPRPKSAPCEVDLHGDCLPEYILDVCYCSCHPAPLVPNRKGGLQSGEPPIIAQFEACAPEGVIQNLRETLNRLSGKAIETITGPSAIGPEEARAKLRTLQERLQREGPMVVAGQASLFPTQESEITRLRRVWDKVNRAFPPGTPEPILTHVFYKVAALREAEKVTEGDHV